MKTGLCDYTVVSGFGLLISKGPGGHARKQSQCSATLYNIHLHGERRLEPVFRSKRVVDSTRSMRTSWYLGKIKDVAGESSSNMLYLRARLDQSGLATR